MLSVWGLCYGLSVKFLRVKGLRVFASSHDLEKALGLPQTI